MITKSWTLSQCCDWMELLWYLLWETSNAFPCRKKTEYNYIGCIISPQYLLPVVSVYNLLQKNIPTNLLPRLAKPPKRRVHVLPEASLYLPGSLLKVTIYMTPTTKEIAFLLGLKPMNFGDLYIRQDYIMT